MKKTAARRKVVRKNRRRVPILMWVIAFLFLIGLPILVLVTQKVQDYRSSAAATTNPLAGMNLHFPYQAAQYYAIADQWESTRPTDAALMRKVADQQKAIWYGEDWAPANNIASWVDTVMTNAATTSAVPVFVAYSIPKRDCSGYSSGGSTNVANYQNWIQQYANGINHRQAIVILEPDALANLDCLSEQEKTDRLAALQSAINTFKAQGAIVYLDGGNARWIQADTMAQRLNQAGIASADGFALNVSNFFSNEESTIYGNQISSQVGNKHFVIDTSRNGLGPYIYPGTGDPQWCNPPGRALGTPATTETGIETVDAFLWVKTPGESDGVCTEFGQNDPSAGTMMPEYAVGMAQRTVWPTPSPTPTTIPTDEPTATTAPTDEPTTTPTPTDIPAATNTPTPTMTPTATPTNTPVPPTPTKTPAPTPGQMIKNNSFENGLIDWYFNTTTPASGRVITTTSTKVDGKSSAQVTITKTSKNTWYVQLRQVGVPLVAGKNYTVTFWAKASKNMTLENDVQQVGGKWTVYNAKRFGLTTKWQLFAYNFKAPATATSQMTFNLAKTAGTIWIDKVTFTAN